MYNTKDEFFKAFMAIAEARANLYEIWGNEETLGGLAKVVCDNLIAADRYVANAQVAINSKEAQA